MNIERDPNKRRVKPVEQACVLDFDEESSDDSDFRIEDHPEQSDDDDSLDSEGKSEDDSTGAETEEEGSDDDLKRLSNNITNTNGHSIADVLSQAALQSNKQGVPGEDSQIMICCGCLGDQSDGVNEIVECDSCGVSFRHRPVTNNNCIPLTDCANS